MSVKYGGIKPVTKGLECIVSVNAISNEREPKSCLGRVFNSKLGGIAILCGKCMA